jgi:hypothetical protein
MSEPGRNELILLLNRNFGFNDAAMEEEPQVRRLFRFSD